MELGHLPLCEGGVGAGASVSWSKRAGHGRRRVRWLLLLLRVLLLGLATCLTMHITLPAAASGDLRICARKVGLKSRGLRLTTIASSVAKIRRSGRLAASSVERQKKSRGGAARKNWTAAAAGPQRGRRGASSSSAMDSWMVGASSVHLTNILATPLATPAVIAWPAS